MHRNDPHAGNPGYRLCFLHIGLEKTGTTSLQTWLYKNQAALHRQGLGLTKSFSKPNNWDFVNYFQDSLDDWAVHRGISSAAEKKAYFSDFVSTFDTEVLSAATPFTLITSEHFSSRLRDRQELLRLREFLKTRFDKVIVLGWFRPQWEVAVSSWSTGLRSGRSESLERWLANVVVGNYYFNYFEVARNWASVFGKENCKFRIYGSSRTWQGDIQRDFLEALSLEGCDLDIAPLDSTSDRKNKSMGSLKAAAVMAVNSEFPFWDSSPLREKTPNQVRKELLQGLPTLKSDIPIRISDAERSRIFEEFKECNEDLSSAFLGGDRFEAPAKTEAAQINDSHELIEDIFNLASHLLVGKSPGQRPTLKDSDADLLRDSALRLLDLNEKEKALSLLRLAQRARPSGHFIRQKIHQLEGALGSESPDFKVVE